jgi:hypothetical protein
MRRPCHSERGTIKKRKSAGVYFQDRHPDDANQWMSLKIPVLDISHCASIASIQSRKRVQTAKRLRFSPA